MDKITPQEAVQLGAADPLFFAQFFFPKAIKQKSPAFHREIWDDLINPGNRYVAIKVFRGGSKTTTLRIFTALRVAYGLSRTILFVSASQNHAVKTVEWLKRAVEFNRPFARTFGLRPGKKWTAEDIEIHHTTEGHTTRVIALGITGQTRGINVDDHRPDLIVVDDPCDEENTATPEQRLKISNLFFGALEKSLVPTTENPHAKMVLLQTPLHGDDLVESAIRDPQWKSLQFGCFTGNEESPVSRWEERFTTKELLAQKAAHIARNQLSLWLREMECKITSTELAIFKPEWIEYWDLLPDKGMRVFMAIDPAPPLSEEARHKGRNTDPQVIAAVGFYQGRTYLLEYSIGRDQDPEDTAAEFFRMAAKWQPRSVGVESIAYQRTLAHFLRNKMRQVGRHYYVQEINDRRKKRDRITQALLGRSANGALYVHKSHVDFIQQFVDYPDVRHDDVLDAVSMAIVLAGSAADENVLEGEFERIEDDERSIPDLPEWRACP
jgi:phage terminase large subunit-like protein